MIRAVADTHALIWHAYNDPRLSATAAAALDAAAAAGESIAVSSISFIEIVYLIEKQRVPAHTLDRVLALVMPGTTLVEVPVDHPIALAMRTIPRAEVPDMPDRIIAATALHLGVPVISRDGKIKASSVATIW